MLLPHKFQLQYSRGQIQEVIEEIAPSITSWADEIRSTTNRDVILLPIMRGGLFFGCDLARAITTSLEILPVRVQGYSLEEINEPEPTLKFDLFEAEVSGRALLLVDDICDSGRTLKALKSELEDRGASTIKAAVLIRRESEGNIHLLPDYVGFNYAGSEWFVGYGMDDLDRYRNLNDIYVIN